MNKGNKN